MVFSLEQPLAETLDIKPLSTGMILAATVVEIEGIYIYDGIQTPPPETQKPPEGGFAPGSRSTRGDMPSYNSG
jgi:hypothetical protein